MPFKLSLMQRILQKAKLKGISSGSVEPQILKQLGIYEGLDFGELVPLYYIKQCMPSFRLIHISVADFEFDVLKSFGQCIHIAAKQTVSEMDETVVIVASGDLSHCLSELSPYGMKAEGARFDTMFNECVENNDFEPLLNMGSAFYDRAGECGLRSFIIMLGGY